MKKLITAFAVGIVVAGTSVTSVGAEEQTHSVEKGETLYSIANDYDTTVDNLMNINNITSTIIYPSQTLKTAGTDDSTYVVQEGDTFKGIADRFGISVNELKAWNDIDGSMVEFGTELTVEDPNPSSNNTVVAGATEEPEGKTISMQSTAYTASCAGCSGVTAAGVDLNSNPNAKVIAVDPSVIPMGTEVYVEGYGYATAADTGGAINGNKIDVHVPNNSEAMNWGNRTVDVTILE